MSITTGNEIPLTDDTISNFGKFLPAPYIERVEVHTDKVTVFVSLFLMTDLYEDTDSMIDYLSGKLNFYVMHAWDGPHSRLVDDESKFGLNEADWDPVIDGKNNIFAAYQEALETTIVRTLGFVNLNALSPLNTSVDWSTSDELYDDNGNKIIKFQTSVDYRWMDFRAGTAMSAPWDSGPGLTSLDFWNVFAFASLYEYNTDDIEETLENIALLDREMSDISYERVFKDGELQHKIVSFVDADDLVYGDIPIQSITGPYYKTDNITRDDMVEYFEEFVTGFKEADTYDSEDGVLNNMLDSISLVVEEYSESTQFLKEMDLRRAYFTSKDPAEPVGKLYTRFRKRIYTANGALENGTQVKKILNRNPKIVDMRFGETLEPATTRAQVPALNTHIYSESFVSRAAFYYTTDGWDESIEPEVVQNRGYFFFDYEKALRQNAVINDVFSVGKLASLGIDVVPYDAFKITEASLLRDESSETDSRVVTISCDFDESVNYPLPDTTTINNESDLDELIIAAPTPSETSTLPEGETSYLVLRNFVPNQTGSISSVIPDYRLSCFEFQDFMSSYWAETITTNEYSVSVTVKDRTIEVAAGLVSYYQLVQELLAAYLDSADDDLSYNTFGEFNTFFSDGITSTYASAEEAPWNVAPVIYCIYQDLIYDLYDGDMDKITDAAQRIMDGIDPYVGNFFILEAFKSAFDDFYTDALSPTSDLGNQVETHEKGFPNPDGTYDTTDHTYEGTVSYTDSIYDVVEEAAVEPGAPVVSSTSPSAWSSQGPWHINFGSNYYGSEKETIEDGFGMVATAWDDLDAFLEDNDRGKLPEPGTRLIGWYYVGAWGSISAFETDNDVEGWGPGDARGVDISPALGYYWFISTDPTTGDGTIYLYKATADLVGYGHASFTSYIEEQMGSAAYEWADGYTPS